MSADDGRHHKTEKNDGDLDSIIANDLLNKNEKLLSVSDHLMRFLSKRLKDINEREMKTNPKVYRCFHCLEFIQTMLTTFVMVVIKVATTSNSIGEHEFEALKQVYVRTMLLLLQITRCTCNVIVFMNVCQQKKWTEQASYVSSTNVIKLEECYRYLEKRISKLERILQEAAEMLKFGTSAVRSGDGGGRVNEVENDTLKFVCLEDRLKLVKLNVADCEERIWITCDRINLTLRDILKRRTLIRMLAGIFSVVSGVFLSCFIVSDSGPVYLRLLSSLGIIFGFAVVVNIIGAIMFKHPGKVPKDFDKYNLERLKSTKEVDDFIISWEKFSGESLRYQA